LGYDGADWYGRWHSLASSGGGGGGGAGAKVSTKY